jgi:hypothetical protein
VLAIPAQAPWKEHKLPPFQGLLVSMSGLARREKARLAEVLARGGGRTSGELNKNCTHLVCKTASGDKHKCAVPVTTDRLAGHVSP